MPLRPRPQARGRTRASSWPPPQAALTLDGTVDSPSAPVVVGLVRPRPREVPGLLPYLVLPVHDRAREPHQRARGGERLHDARPALSLSVGPLLHVVGAQALPVRRRESRGRPARRARLQHRRRPRAVLGPDELGRLLVEQRVERPLDGLPH